MVDAHSTQVLNRVISEMPDTTSFLVDTFFPSVEVSGEETILFDTTNGRKLVTPFVSPLAEAPIVAQMGYETDSFRPAYLKDKRLFNPNMGSKRLPGEKIGGELTPDARIKRAIKANLREQIDMIGGRLEMMAGEILRTGKIIIKGENYPETLIDFKRRAQNRVVKLTTARWGESNVSPWNDIEYEAQELSDATGYMPTDVLFDPLAWAYFAADARANHKDEIDKDLKNGGMTEILAGYINQPRDGVVYRGRSGYLRFWTYTGTYTDPEDGVTKKTLGDYEVIIGGASIDGVRHFGAIKDFDAGLQARQYFVKSDKKFDPSGIEYLMQSAPLLVPYRRNNVKSIKVR